MISNAKVELFLENNSENFLKMATYILDHISIFLRLGNDLLRKAEQWLKFWTAIRSV